MIARVFLIALTAAAGLAQAQQYRWMDEKGRIQYSDRPPASSAKDVKKKGFTSAPAVGESQAPFELQRVQKDFPVTLYTAPDCTEPCSLARGALNKRGVPFKEVQVWNVETIDQMKALTGSDNVPALVVGRSVQSGFESGRFEGLLDSAGYPKAGVLPARSQEAPAPPAGYEPPPAAEPVKPAAEAPRRAGPYDASGLKSTETRKPGPYGVPGERK